MPEFLKLCDVIVIKSMCWNSSRNKLPLGVGVRADSCTVAVRYQELKLHDKSVLFLIFPEQRSSASSEGCSPWGSFDSIIKKLNSRFVFPGELCGGRCRNSPDVTAQVNRHPLQQTPDELVTLCLHGGYLWIFDTMTILIVYKWI